MLDITASRLLPSGSVLGSCMLDSGNAVVVDRAELNKSVKSCLV